MPRTPWLERVGPPELLSPAEAVQREMMMTPTRILERTLRQFFPRSH